MRCVYAATLESGGGASIGRSTQRRPGADLVARAVGHVHGTELVEMEPLPAGDDMTYFLQAAPGAYFFVGTRSDQAGSTYPHYHPASRSRAITPTRSRDARPHRPRRPRLTDGRSLRRTVPSGSIASGSHSANRA